MDRTYDFRRRLAARLGGAAGPGARAVGRDGDARFRKAGLLALFTLGMAASLSACDGGVQSTTTGGGGPGGTGGTGGAGATTSMPDPSDALFDPAHVVEVAVEMAPADWDALRHQSRSLMEMLGEGCQDGPHESPYTTFPASVTVDGEKLDGSGIRKKGFLGSASTSKPSLKISFDEYEAGREAFGVEGLTLNNSKQDPSLVKTCLTLQLFRGAGLPASRCNFAHVTLNGADLGVYVNIEPVTKRLLARHFTDASGNLYEGQISDFRPGWSATYEKKTNESDPDRSDLDLVTAALEEPDAGLEAALGQVVDIDVFNSFWAMEVLVAAWDGYTGNLNNHLVYHDPTSGKMFFLPWGPDMSFDADDPFLPGDRPQSVSARGTIARRLHGIPAHREKYVARMNELLDTTWKEPELLAEIDRVQALLAPYLGADAAKVNSAADGVRQFVNERRQAITSEISTTPPDWPYPAPAAACLPTVGTVSGTFSTTFGTLISGNPFASGDGVLDVEIPVGTPASASEVGAMAGYENSSKVTRRLIVLGNFPDGKQRAIVFDVSPEAFASGQSLPYDWQSVNAFILDIPAPGQYDVFGLFAEGTLTLDEASTTAGAPVTGSFSATAIETFLQ